MKQKLRSGDEYDAVHKYSRSIYNWKRGVLKKIKRGLNKRVRKEGIEIEEEHIDSCFEGYDEDRI